MRLKKLLRKVLLGLLVFLAPLSLALASPLSLQNSRPLFSIFGGVARLNPSQTQSYTGADDTQFNYSRQVPYDFMGFAGLFLGLEHPLSNLPFFTQVGLEYTLFSGDKISGQHSVGMDPSTFTSYQYHYLFQSRQFLFKAKILTLIKQRFYPYLFFGLGPAFNTLGNFQVSPTQSGSLNLTPTFETHTQ
ncbi:MAG TPA: hypothetical protein VLH77_05100, partial [Gammaproteobacteria bacterium]|nr:hypothetical protein [Gammaproteobacteria bacterium]